jgi:hypothetical protein
MTYGIQPYSRMGAYKSQARAFANQGLNMLQSGAGAVGLGKGSSAARIAGKAAPFLAKGARFLGPLHLGIAAVGAAGNLVNRLGKGEGLAGAVAGTAYDTADYAAFGLLKPTVGLLAGGGQAIANAATGNSPEKAMQSSLNMPGAPGYNRQLSVNSANSNLMDVNSPYNPLGNYQQAAESRRRQQQIFDNDMLNANADRALDRSYLADNYKGGIQLAQSAFGAQQQQIAARQRGIQQAALMRY